MFSLGLDGRKFRNYSFLVAFVVFILLDTPTRGAGGTFMDSDETGLGGLLRPGPGKTMSGGKNGVRGNDNYGLPSGSSIPFFAKNDTETGLITAQLSTDIELNCTVENLGDKTVSWFRRFGNETHLLTVGLNTYIRDSRVSLTYVLHNNWQLRIANTETSDAGTYLCEVSTHPPIHREVQLKVVVPQVIVIDEHGGELTEKFYKTGSTIELKCIVKEVPSEQAYVVWTHMGRQLNYDTSRGGISVKTEATPAGTVSRLYLANAGRTDSGNYTCSVSNLASASVFLNVLTGQQPGALHIAAGQRASQDWLLLLATALASVSGASSLLRALAEWAAAHVT